MIKSSRTNKLYNSQVFMGFKVRTAEKK